MTMYDDISQANVEQEQRQSERDELKMLAGEAEKAKSAFSSATSNVFGTTLKGMVGEARKNPAYLAIVMFQAYQFMNAWFDKAIAEEKYKNATTKAAQEAAVMPEERAAFARAADAAPQNHPDANGANKPTLNANATPVPAAAAAPA